MPFYIVRLNKHVHALMNIRLKLYGCVCGLEMKVHSLPFVSKPLIRKMSQLIITGMRVPYYIINM